MTSLWLFPILSSEINDPFLTDSNTKGDYGQTFASMTRVIFGHYYEHFKQVKKGNLYYLDQTTSLISFFIVVGACPELSETEQNEQIGLVIHELHLAMSEYTVTEF